MEQKMRQWLKLTLSILTEDENCYRMDASKMDGFETFRVLIQKSKFSKVLGRNGKTISAIRWLFHCMHRAAQKDVYLSVVEREDINNP